MIQNALSQRRPAPTPTAGARPRNMAPKEHGAWGQLGFPLLTAIALGSPGFVAGALLISAVAMFMAHEPLVVLLGLRGTRAAREAATPARWRLNGLIALAIACGTAALWAGNASVRLAAGAGLGAMLVAVFGFLVKGRERSTLGEVWIAWTLPSAAVPVALASGVPLGIVLASWVSFSLAYSSGVYGVRGIIQNHREGRATAGWMGLGLVLLGILLLFALSWHAAAAALFFWTVVAVSRWARPSPKSLKRIGWLLVASSTVQAAWLITALRGLH